MGLTAGREGGREAGRQNIGRFQNFKTSLKVKLFGILLQYYNCIQLAFVKLNFILRCVLKCKKIGSHCFMSIRTIRH